MECVCPILERATAVEETGVGRDPWSLVRCRETGFVFLPNPPEYSQLETEFAWENTSDAESNRREAEQPIAARVSSATKSAKRIAFPRRNKMATLTTEVVLNGNFADPIHLLDIGCGSGDLLLALHARLAQAGRTMVPYGIEVSKQLAAQTHARVATVGGKVLSTNALDGISQFKGEQIDVATMSSYLEHESRPLAVLQQLHSILASEGVVVLKVPNFACWNRRLRGDKWCGFRFPDHVNYFTPGTLQRVAEEAGFTVARQNFLDKFALSDNMYAVLTKR
jgi:2-polyprenyl-3-methyl-5-hydroxy-6-metoxy-1,4-benzoquinol methylase